MDVKLKRKMKKIVLFLTVAAVLVGCKKEYDNDIKVKNLNTEVKAGRTIQIEATSLTPITYLTENEFYASVSSTGLVTANRVGDVNILLNNSEKTANVKAKITPVYSTYKDPYLNFGASKEEVIKYAGTPSRVDNDGTLIYENYSTAALLAMYSFENSKLEAFTVGIKTSYASELGSFLRERYFQFRSESPWIYYCNSLNANTATIMIGVNVSISALVVVYIPTDNFGLRSAGVNIEKYVDKFEKIVK